MPDFRLMFSELFGEGRCFGQNEVKKFLAAKISTCFWQFPRKCYKIVVTENKGKSRGFREKVRF